MNNQGFLFSNHETLYGRAGLYLQKEHMTVKDVVDAMKEIEELYKETYGYKCVKVIRNRNDPLMVDVYVIPNNSNYCKYY